jgi:ATP-binding cassette, subfamily B, bacterial
MGHDGGDLPVNGGGYWTFARMAWRTSPGLSVLTFVTVVLTAAAPLGTVFAIGRVVDHLVTDSATGSVDRGGAMAWAVAAGACFLLQWLTGALQRAGATALGERIDSVLQRDLMSAVMAPTGIGHLEDPRTVGLVDVGRETLRADWGRPGRLAATVGGLITGRVLLGTSSVVVGGFAWWLGLALLASGLWAAYEDRVASRIEAAHHYGETESARRMQYYNDLGAAPAAAKEVRVFGLRDFLLDHYAATWDRTMAHVLRPAGRRPLVATAALGAVVLLGVVFLVREAVSGRLGAGPAAVYVQLLMVAVGGIQQSSWAGLQTELALATLRRYQDAVAAARKAVVPITGGERPADGLPAQEIRLHRVSFAYPGGGDVLHELDLVIPAGRSMAIVGANGAGKSSLIKLLCRLYEPTAGQITVDGVDITKLDVSSWWRRLAVVFQQPTRFAVAARTNVEFGRVDVEPVLEDVARAGADAGVANTIGTLAKGWETLLSSEYAGGTDLSGGEWQKIGLARALFAVRHGASVLILDEPAANLDARSEARLHRHFLELTEGVTTVVISHRFSTVRQAASIVVLDGGRVAEQGTHDELIALDGSYAEMFRLQASRFADPPEPEPTGPMGMGRL